MEIQWNGSRLFYEKAGSGPNLLLFHGFGQDHSAFDPLIASVSDQYTCYSFDLFFHGQSSWKNRGPVTFGAWKQIIEAFIQRENITRFSVLGFSIGARFALATFIVRPDMAQEVILVAPDGVRDHPLFTLATAFSPNRMAFRWLAESDYLFPAMASLAKRLRMAPAGSIRFAESQMRTKAARLKVYATWVSFRKLRFEERHLSELLRQHHVKVVILLAGNDRIIHEKGLKKFISLLNHPIVETLGARHSHILISLARVFKKVVTGQNGSQP